MGRRVDAVCHRRRSQDPELRRQIIGEALHDDGIATQRQMRAVLLGGAHGHDQAGPLLQPFTHRAGGHLFYAPGLSGLSHRAWPWVVVVLAAALSAAEWLRRPGWAWVAALAAALVALLLLLRPLTGWRRRGLAAALAWLVAASVVSQIRLTAI